MIFNAIIMPMNCELASTWMTYSYISTYIHAYIHTYIHTKVQWFSLISVGLAQIISAQCIGVTIIMWHIIFSIAP